MIKKRLHDNFIMMMVHIIMTAFKSLSDKYSGQVRKNVSLYKGYQYFYKINEHGKANGYWWKTPTHAATQVAKNKNEWNEANNNNVPRNHVCEQTYDQREWLCEYSQYLHRNHDGFYSARYRRVEYMRPIMFVGAKKNNNKGNNSQYQCKGNVTRNVSSTGDQSNDIIN